MHAWMDVILAGEVWGGGFRGGTTASERVQHHERKIEIGKLKEKETSRDGEDEIGEQMAHACGVV